MNKLFLGIIYSFLFFNIVYSNIEIISVNGITNSNEWTFNATPQCSLILVYSASNISHGVTYNSFVNYSSPSVVGMTDRLVGGVPTDGTYVTDVQKISVGTYSKLYTFFYIYADGVSMEVLDLTATPIQCVTPASIPMAPVTIVSYGYQYGIYSNSTIPMDPLLYVVARNFANVPNFYNFDTSFYTPITQGTSLRTFDSAGSTVMVYPALSNYVNPQLRFAANLISNTTLLPVPYNYPTDLATSIIATSATIVPVDNLSGLPVMYRLSFTIVGADPRNVSSITIGSLFKDDDILPFCNLTTLEYSRYISLPNGIGFGQYLLVFSESLLTGNTLTYSETSGSLPPPPTIGSYGLAMIDTRYFQMNVSYSSKGLTLPSYTVTTSKSTLSTIQYPYGVTGNLYNGTIQMVGYHPNIRSLVFFLRSGFTLNLYNSTTAQYDIYPPQIMNINIYNVGRSKWISFNVSDSSGIEVCYVDYDNLNLKFTAANAESLSNDHSFMQFTAEVSAAYIPVTCGTTMKIGCYDKLKNYYQYKSGEVYSNNTDVTVPSVSCPDIIQPQPLFIRMRHLLDSVTNISTPYLQITYLNEQQQQQQYQVSVDLTDSLNHTTNIPLDTQQLNTTMFVAVGSLDILKPTVTTTYSIQLNFNSITASYTLTSSQLYIILNRRNSISVTNVPTPGLINQLTLYSADVNPPIVTDVSYSIDSTNNKVDFTITAVDDLSGVRDMTITYYSTVDYIVRNQTVQTNGIAKFTIATPITTCGNHTLSYIISRVCDNSNNCLIVAPTTQPNNIIINSTVENPSSLLELVDFSTSTNVLFTRNTTSSDRNVIVDYTIRSALPIASTVKSMVYVQDSYPWSINTVICQSTFMSSQSNLYSFRCSVDVPLNFGLSNTLLVSIEGTYDICGNMRSFNSIDLQRLTVVKPLQVSPNQPPTPIQVQPMYAGTKMITIVTNVTTFNTSLMTIRTDTLEIFGYNLFSSPLQIQAELDRIVKPNDRIIVDYDGIEYNVQVFSNYSGSPVIVFEETRPWCVYSINGTPTSNTTTELSYEDQQFSFFIKFFSLIEMSATGDIIHQEEFSQMKKSGTATNFTMTSTLANGANVVMSMLISNNYTDVKWMNESLVLHNNTVKYSIDVSNYPFSTKLNYLLITFNITANSTGECELEQLTKSVMYGNSFIRSNYNEKEPSFKYECEEYDEDDKKNWLIPVAVVVPIVGLTILIAVAIVIYKRNTTMHVYMTKMKTRLSRKSSVSMKATSFQN
ncbi:hypothetical protein PPL_06106 [Heterostelium album PN500]|uniref:DUF7034 domain-containing protein n=1 Tax=Heterostelium pallidum (strain ATCC 26659 / Pp 5 / PN500) TaxID=670386 RepID=D3BC83_HETP5|nr:hypothetical protein PPL_06106 [Heterostelium album PN500]EFA81266.1 hypothetical protein PPL_06106 [Heterostelium album PN500]|eukprot:XP_020433384.1 hypothetical protein PPL_06106 [Heterostelium album PN500]